MQNNQTENEKKSPTKNCPFCCSEIQEAAQKCPYCGEWVVRRKETMSPSDMARSVNRGLKQKEVDDWWFNGCLHVLFQRRINVACFCLMG